MLFKRKICVKSSMKVKSQNSVEQIRKEFENNISDKKEALYESQIKYLSKLNLLFGSEFHLKE